MRRCSEQDADETDAEHRPLTGWSSSTSLAGGESPCRHRPSISALFRSADRVIRVSIVVDDELSRRRIDTEIEHIIVRPSASPGRRR
jgi:hypothetical protein